MTGPSWQIPVELVRASADLRGTTTLVQLAARHAAFQPHASVELCPGGFVATVGYRLPSYVERVQEAHITLAGAPDENRLAVNGAGEGRA